jgi:Fic family protein
MPHSDGGANIPIYIHQRPNWPDFQWEQPLIASELREVRLLLRHFVKQMRSLPDRQQEKALLACLTEEIVRSSEIEGENLDREAVQSLLAWRLGVDADALPPSDRQIEGIVEMMLDATYKFKTELTAERLFGWHASLFPTGRSNMKKISVGAWRDSSAGPMQVISGDYGSERVHYEAPAAEKLNREMRAFLAWYNRDEKIDPIVKAAIAHLWFVTIHPFEDGNGRIGRAIAESLLARAEGTSLRFYSMSAQMCHERQRYYDSLETAQRGDLDISNWIVWFLACLSSAIKLSEESHQFIHSL